MQVTDFLEQNNLSKHNSFSKIRTNYHNLSEGQKKVADFILENPDKVIKNTLKETAETCDVSEPTIFRFLKKIGYDSYQIFRIDLAKDSEQIDNRENIGNIDSEDSYGDIKDKVIYSTIKSSEDFMNILDEKTIASFIAMVEKAERILVIGVGASFAVATDLYHKLIKLGYYCEKSNDPHMINLLTSNLGEKDVMITVSHSGESREILDAVYLARENGVKILSITSYSNSTLASLSHSAITTPSYEGGFRFESMTSRILQIMTIDIIYISMLLDQGEDGMKRLYESRKVVSKNKT